MTPHSPRNFVSHFPTQVYLALFRPVMKLLRFVDADHADVGLYYNLCFTTWQLLSLACERPGRTTEGEQPVPKVFHDLPAPITRQSLLEVARRFKDKWTFGYCPLHGAAYLLHPEYHDVPDKLVNNTDISRDGWEMILVRAANHVHHLTFRTHSEF